MGICTQHIREIPQDSFHNNTRLFFVCQKLFFDIVCILTTIGIVTSSTALSHHHSMRVPHLLIAMLSTFRAHHRCLSEDVVHFLCCNCEESFHTHLFFCRQPFGQVAPMRCGRLHDSEVASAETFVTLFLLRVVE